MLAEEQLWLETVAARLRQMGYDAYVEMYVSLSYDNPTLFVRGRDDFSVWTGGEESGYKMQLVGDLLGKCDTFIDVPFDRPVTSAYIIHRYMEDNPLPEVPAETHVDDDCYIVEEVDPWGSTSFAWLFEGSDARVRAIAHQRKYEFGPRSPQTEGFHYRWFQY